MALFPHKSLSKYHINKCDSCEALTLATLTPCELNRYFSSLINAWCLLSFLNAVAGYKHTLCAVCVIWQIVCSVLLFFLLYFSLVCSNVFIYWLPFSSVCNNKRVDYFFWCGKRIVDNKNKLMKQKKKVENIFIAAVACCWLSGKIEVTISSNKSRNKH